MTDNLSNPKLAVVIPAYKAKFLREALQSIAAQTSRNFRLYVGDDCSPEPVGEIIREFSGQIPLEYHRFDSNLGGTSLVQQWERCIRLSNEPWVWLFSDDDIMEPRCVAAFLKELEKTDGQHDLYRFNTVWINAAKNSSEENPAHPLEEPGVDFLRAKLRNLRRSTLQELVFSRQAWKACGGIPDFPRAWASDDAFIAKLGGSRTIRAISGQRVIWRLSDVNITNDNSAASIRAKLQASEEFIRWIKDYITQPSPAAGKLSRTEMIHLTENWLFAFVDRSWRFMGWRASWQIDKIAADVWGYCAGYGFCKTQVFNLRHFIRKGSGKIKRLFHANA